MLRITIEDVAANGSTRILGIAHITQVAADKEYGDYFVKLFQAPRFEISGAMWKAAKFVRFPFTRLGHWDLLLRGLAAAVSSRNREVEIPEEKTFSKQVKQ